MTKMLQGQALARVGADVGAGAKTAIQVIQHVDALGRPLVSMSGTKAAADHAARSRSIAKRLVQRLQRGQGE
eukprot:1008548-Pyramimonas_sp.AAC.1